MNLERERAAPPVRQCCVRLPPPMSHLETVRCPFALYTFIVMHFSHAESSLVMSEER